MSWAYTTLSIAMWFLGMTCLLGGLVAPYHREPHETPDEMLALRRFGLIVGLLCCISGKVIWSIP